MRSAETRVWYEFCESVCKASLGKVIFVSSHGGQPQIMKIGSAALAAVERGRISVERAASG